MTYKEKSKASINKHIQTATSIKGKNPGAKRDAWQELKALEILVKAARS